MLFDWVNSSVFALTRSRPHTSPAPLGIKTGESVGVFPGCVTPLLPAVCHAPEKRSVFPNSPTAAAAAAAGCSEASFHQPIFCLARYLGNTNPIKRRASAAVWWCNVSVQVGELKEKRLTLIGAFSLLLLLSVVRVSEAGCCWKHPEKEQCFLSSSTPSASVAPPCETKLISNLTPSLPSTKSKLSPSQSNSLLIATSVHPSFFF